MALIFGKNRLPIFDAKEKQIKKLQDENAKIRMHLTYLSNALSYAYQILDGAGLNSPDNQRNMEALLQGKEPYLGESDG